MTKQRPPARRTGGTPRLGIVVLALGLGGCASLSQEECLRGDWSAIGYTDGVQGRLQTRLGDHFEACADYGVRPDPAAYRSAWAKGVEVYCQPAQGFEVGAAGRTYRGVCPPHLEGRFLPAYRAGRGLHERREAVDEGERDLRRAESDLDDVREAIRERERKLARGGLDPAQRERLHAELRDLAARHGRLDERRARLEDELRDTRDDLADYERHLHRY